MQNAGIGPLKKLTLKIPIRLFIMLLTAKKSWYNKTMSTIICVIRKNMKINWSIHYLHLCQLLAVEQGEANPKIVCTQNAPSLENCKLCFHHFLISIRSPWDSSGAGPTFCVFNKRPPENINIYFGWQPYSVCLLFCNILNYKSIKLLKVFAFAFEGSCCHQWI